MNTVIQAHQNLKKLLLTGRILVNGLPLTVNELSTILQGEQMLFEKASKYDEERQAAKAPVEKLKTIPKKKG